MFPYVLFFFRRQACVVNLSFISMRKDSSKFFYPKLSNDNTSLLSSTFF